MRLLIHTLLFAVIATPASFAQDDGTLTSHRLDGKNLQRMSHMMGAILIPKDERQKRIDAAVAKASTEQKKAAVRQQQEQLFGARDAFFNGLGAWKAAGNDPMIYLDNAFGPYVQKAQEMYAAKGQIITFDPALNALDQAVIIHSMSKRNDVPNLKSAYREYDSGRKTDVVRTHYVLDEAHLNSMKRSLGADAFAVVYEGVEERVPNPIRLEEELTSQTQLDKLIVEYKNDSVFMNDIVPDLQARLKARNESDPPVTLDYLVYDPKRPIRQAAPNSVVVEFPWENKGAYWAVDAKHERFGGYEIRDQYGDWVDLGAQMYSLLGDLSEEQIDLAYRVNVGASDAAAWQTQITNSNGSNNYNAQVESMIRGAQVEALKICGEE